MLIFGNGGAGKTLTALNLDAGLLGLDGYGYLLGEPITPLPAGESVLFLALDGPAETAASWRRLKTPAGRDVGKLAGDRLTVRTRLPLSPSHDDSGAVAEYVRQLETNTGQRFAAVTVDNLVKLYGDVSQPGRASFAAVSLAALEADGRSLVVITQSKKNTRPKNEDGALLAQGALFGMGTILSLYKTREGTRDGDRPTVAELRHYKGPGADGGKPSAVSIDLPTGRLSIEADADLRADVAKLPAAAFSSADIADALEVSQPTASRFATKAEAAGQITFDHKGVHGAKYWRKVGK